MNQTWKVTIVVVLIVSVIAVLTIKRNKSEQATETSTETTADVNNSAQQARNINEEQIKIDLDSGTTSEITASADDTEQPDRLVTENLPMLIDLGSDECIPCKEMAPILEELKTEYAGNFKVEFMDVRKDPLSGTIYNIKLIPTQIFFDASGKELFRHEGFYSKNDILSKWKELGFEMTQTK
jgi:thioredoxin 1